VVGTRSFIWRPGDLERLERLAAEGRGLTVHRLEGAGHWVHTDAPEALERLLAETLP
jgi:pimeloyl-ACP methyl ester carboxylesterase